MQQPPDNHGSRKNYDFLIVSELVELKLNMCVPVDCSGHYFC